MILGLSTNLLVRYQALYRACGQPPYNDQCDSVSALLGGFKYCVVPPIIAFCDVGIWLTDAYVKGLPWRFVVWFGWVVQGFYLGGGCVCEYLSCVRFELMVCSQTIASQLNSSWHCRGGMLCSQVYTATAFFFIATVLVWIRMMFMHRLTDYHSSAPLSG